MTNKTMKAVSIFAPGSVGIVNEPVPEPGSRQVLCAVKAAGICGTDHGIYSGEFEGRIHFPLRPGHEWAGVVLKAGEDVRDIVIGDRVVGESSISCGQCEPCRSGQKIHCTHLRSIGTIDDAEPGAMAEYILYPACDLLRLPDNVSFEQGALIEPAANALMAIEEAPVRPGDIVVIMGTGPIGIAAAAIARLYGAQTVISVGRSPSKLTLCKALGATHILNTKEVPSVEQAILRITDGRRVDVAIELSGAHELFKACIAVMKPKGVLSLLAFYTTNIDLNLNDIILGGIAIKPAGGGWGYFDKVLALMESGKLNLTSMITSRVTIEEAPDEIKSLKLNNADKIKVMILNEE